VQSGAHFARDCVGSSIGLMAVLVTLGLMSVTWTTVFSMVILLQTLMSSSSVIDLLLPTALIGLGFVILATQSSVPVLVPA
jgi:predicted metal-binding membrane protein